MTLETATAQKTVTLKKHPVKLTALLYLKEALLSEKYEDCQGTIDIAYEFGAQESDIHFLIEDPRRNPLP